MRDTASTGTTGPGCVPHTTRARMNCDVRSLSLLLAIRALNSTVCVVLSTCGEMNLIRLSATTLPAPSKICTVKLILTWEAHSPGTYTYPSSLPVLSTVVRRDV